LSTVYGNAWLFTKMTALCVLGVLCVLISVSQNRFRDY
jgi:hypothetical protein